jgi:hypothetical protein
VINAAADRHHLLDLDHLRTDRACAGGRPAFAAALVARCEIRTTSLVTSIARSSSSTEHDVLVKPAQAEPIASDP